MKLMKQTGHTWWEKTVEYTYLTLLPNGVSIAPLAGKHEAMGDAALRWGDYLWQIVEFKREAADIPSENKKYLDGRRQGEGVHLISRLLNHVAKLRDAGEFEPHYLIYGADVSDGMLQLEARRYWGKWFDQDFEIIGDSEIQALSRNSTLEAWPLEQFNEYAQLLLAAKNAGKTTSSSGGFGKRQDSCRVNRF